MNKDNCDGCGWDFRTGGGFRNQTPRYDAQGHKSMVVVCTPCFNMPCGSAAVESQGLAGLAVCTNLILKAIREARLR